MTQLSTEQEQALANMRKPKGWDTPNLDLSPAPFAYYNSYTSPAFTSGLQSGTGIQSDGSIGYSNQFTSALVQSPDAMNNTPQAGGAITRDGVLNWRSNIPPPIFTNTGPLKPLPKTPWK